MPASAAAAEPDVDAESASAPQHDGDGIRPVLRAATLAVVVGAMAVVMFATHRSGHWWGDDWALYLRQAQSLVDGNPGEISADNRFTVDQSMGAPFSPPLYPWGFPLLLAPFVAVVGVDVDALHVVPVVFAAVFACSWFALARRRLGTVAAFVATVAATLTPLLLSWSELLQSEWPFLAVVFTMLVALDRAIESRVLVDVSARWWPVALLGVGAAAAFSVRREGLAVTAAIAAAQLALLTTGAPRLVEIVRDRRLVGRLLLPYASAAATVLVLQAVLPSTLVPQYSGSGIHNSWEHIGRHVRHLADVSGLKRPWDRDAVVLGSTTVGWIAIAVYLVAAGVGIVLALLSHRRRDLHLVVYAVTAFAIGTSPTALLNRYVATVGPVLFLLGLIALTRLPGRGRVRWGRALATVAALSIVVGNVANAHLRIDRADAAADAGAVEWGPTHPAAIEMFDAVVALTDPDDVVAGPKARALTLMTDRRSIQVDRWRPLPRAWSPDLVVTEKGTPPEASLRAESERYGEVWSNNRFVLFGALTDAGDG